jgi:hypothetical protein
LGGIKEEGKKAMNMSKTEVPPRARPGAEVGLLRENISPPTGKPAPGRKILLGWQPWKAMRRNRMDWVPFYWAPGSLRSK